MNRYIVCPSLVDGKWFVVDTVDGDAVEDAETSDEAQRIADEMNSAEAVA